MSGLTELFIFELLLFLVAAGIGRLISKKTKQPIVLGEILMGMLLANIGLLIGMPDLIQVSDAMSQVADLGILLLLFSAGLELDFNELKSVGKSSFIVAMLGVIVPFGFGFLVARFFGFPNTVSLFMGLCLVATSVGITAEILREMDLLRTKMGSLIIGASVIDDVVGIVFMGIILSVIASGSFSILEIMPIVIAVIAFFFLSLTIGVNFFKEISKTFWMKKENLVMFGLIIALAFAVTSESIGLTAITGSFLAGLVLGQSQFSKDLLNPMYLLGEAFFVPIFFLTTGMLFKLGALGSFSLLLLAIGIIIAGILSKIIGAGAGARLFGFTKRESLFTGVAMVPRAEVALVLVKVGIDHQFIDSSFASVILLLVVFTTFFPLIILPKLGKKLKGNPLEGRK